MENIVLSVICGLILAIVLGFLLLRTSKPKDKVIKKSSKESIEVNKEVSINANLMEKKPNDMGGIINRSNKGSENSKKNNNVSPVSWGVTESYEKELQKESSLNTINKLDIKVEEKPTEIIISSDITKNQDFNEDIDLENQQRNSKPLILLVDDSMTILKFTSNILGKNGYDVITKADGEDALNYLYGKGNLKPDLILSDIEMPKMNGIELIKKIREDAKFNKTPIIIISSHAESHLSLMTDGLIQGFMHKPFKDFELLEQLKYVLDK